MFLGIYTLTLSCIVKFCFATTEIEVVFLWLDIFLEHDTSDRILRDLAFDFDSTEQAIPQEGKSTFTVKD